MALMKAAVLNEFGPVECLQLSTLPRPVPGKGELLIKVAYAGVNPADWKDREGSNAQFFDITFPYVIGFDAAGTVAEVGAGVSGFSSGDRVFTSTDHGQGKQGSYAEFVIASQQRAAHIPEGLDFISAAVTPVAALTAWQALFAKDKGGLSSGQRVLIHGASGGVGSFALQFARWTGARVATTCSEANLGYVRGLGAELCIDYRQSGLVTSIREWAPMGVDLVIDAVGGDTLLTPYELVKPGGRIVNIMTLVDDGDIAKAISSAAERDITRVFAIMSDSQAGEELTQIAQLIVEKHIEIPPIECFDLADVQLAHRKIQTGHVRGKLAIRVSEDC